jgi:thiamine monophosphate synthase
MAKQHPAARAPIPRLYLATPIVDDPSALIANLPALLADADVAAVLLRLAQADPRSIISRIKALAPAIQDSGAALLIEGNAELVARSGADGAHLTGIEAMQEAHRRRRRTFHPPRFDERGRSRRRLRAVRRTGRAGTTAFG